MDTNTIIIAFAGYPNCGKTTLFNTLTHSHEPVGNWSGVTVTVKKAMAKLGSESLQFVDLPGCYTLSAAHTNTPIDEIITQTYLQSNEANCILNVLDATKLEQQLALTFELLEQGLPVIVVLNMMDAAYKQGKELDIVALSDTLGCPVIPVSALEAVGLENLKIMLKKVTPKKCPSFSSQSERKQLAQQLADKVSQKTIVQRKNWSDMLDKILLHKRLGLPLLLLFIYLAFGFTIRVGGGIQDIFTGFLQKILIESPQLVLQAMAAPTWIIHLFTQGIGQGIHTTLSFVPVIAAMFLCLSFLEASGYMARAALVMDKVMQCIGLSGKSFIPMILGFGCNVPAILATRTLECKKERILTSLMSPFMSCGARLAIYALFVTAFFNEGGHNVIFALYCIGILMALLTGWVLRSTLLIGNKTPLKMELPPYRWPRLKSVFRVAFHRTYRFVTKAGMIIVPLCILFGLLSSWNIGEETGLASLGKYLTPLLSPMGILPGNWQAVVGLLAGGLAKEVVVGTLNALYFMDAGNGSLGTMVDHFGSVQAAFAYLIFVLLYFPCISVLATIARELSMAWAIFTAVWTTGLAYGAAVLFYQVATFSEHPGTSIAWLLMLLGVSAIVWYGLRVVGRHTVGKKPQKHLPTQILILNS